MSIENVKKHLASFGLAERILEFKESSATVALAAQALGCEPAHIAKTLSFNSANEEDTILIVAAGDSKIDNTKFKNLFGIKPKMLPSDLVEDRVGHAIGGVCPFGVNEHVKVYTDISLQRFPVIYPAAGTAASAVRLNCNELFDSAGSLGWVDVCKGWQ